MFYYDQTALSPLARKRRPQQQNAFGAMPMQNATLTAMAYPFVSPQQQQPQGQSLMPRGAPPVRAQSAMPRMMRGF